MSEEQQLPELYEQHYQWILGAAFDDFQSKIEEYELKVLRLRGFQEPILKKSGMSDPREKALKQAEDYLAQYRRILLWLSLTIRDLTEHQSQASAKDLGEFLRGQVRLPGDLAANAKAAKAPVKAGRKKAKQ